ncbi:hypothetical protein F5Y17DRAFT_450481 [Xylariaceae sp. FL0594]|nr:hypothetical protein F5Y17DRAFT_450481 [Xylariaceae sp. FL0594]
MHSSFQIGGPLALIGTFYSTSDTARNVQNRKALEFLQAAANESRSELFKRAGTFPVHSSAKVWYQRILGKLNQGVQSLAYLLLCLGVHPQGISSALLMRARQPSRTWNLDGDALQIQPELEPYVGDEARFESAIHELKSIGLLRSGPGIHVDPNVGALVDGEHLGALRGKAAKLVCHAYPKHRALESHRYLELCELLAPYLQHTLSYPLGAVEQFKYPFVYPLVGGAMIDGVSAYLCGEKPIEVPQDPLNTSPKVAFIP